MAGRAWQAELFPLNYIELGKSFSLEKVLLQGSLPAVYTSAYPEEELKAYAHTYLYEEIQAESLVRKIPQFSRFLKIAALSYGELINFANVSSDAGVPASTIKEHYKILEDTFIGYPLEPWKLGKKRKAIQTSKFYFFDNGVAHTLSGVKSIDPNSNLWGKSFEQWLIGEVRTYISYKRKDDPLSFWRSTNRDEVDLIIGDHTAIEIKTTKKVSDKDIKDLRAIQEESKFKNYLLVSHDKIEHHKGNIDCLHYSQFLKKLWAGDYF